MEPYVIGLDFGTESARALLVSTKTGEILATAVHAYPDGVIDDRLPGSTEKLPPNYALQNPADWLTAVVVTVRTVMQHGGIEPEQVVGLGIDFTSCTVLPALADGSPLCQDTALKREPHTWAKLWKHHGAQSQADRINRLAVERQEAWLPRYGGKVSSEWLMPKALEILEEAPQVYHRMHVLVEGADWVAWQLTGRLTRNTCCAGYKATWHKRDGFPAEDFLAGLHPQLSGLYRDKVQGPTLAPGERVGGLTVEWADRLGLQPGTAVAAGIIDAHSAAIGGGVSQPGVMYMVMGTSTCHMLMAQREVLVEGISGVVEDGIVPGLYGYEAGQVSVGDIFGWYVEHGAPASCSVEAKARGVTLHELLTEKALALRPAESGLLALDWWNGCRTPLVDADLTGLIVGYTLQTRPEEVYRALVEATAFGTRQIVELFRQGGVEVNRLRAGGGLTQNPLVMQVYADVTGVPIEVSASPQASALGAAILGAVAGGVYPDIHAAVQHMALPPAGVIDPDGERHAIYNELYAAYRNLVDLFGRDPGSTMKQLLSLRNRIVHNGEERE